MKKRIIALILCFAICLSAILAFAGCNDDPVEQGKSEFPTATDTIEDFTEHKVEGTIHMGYENLKDEGMPFVIDGKTDYKIVYDENNSFSTKASRYIMSQLGAATGASMEKEESPIWSEDAKYIIVDNEELQTAAGVVMTDIDLGVAGYQILTKGNSVFILTTGNDSYQMAALAFLRIVVGYDFISENIIVYEKDGSYIPEMNIIERPDFDYRYDMVYYQHSINVAYGMGLSENGSLFISTGSDSTHNSFWYLNPKEYEFSHENCNLGYTDEECAEGHKNWYSELRCGYAANDGSWGATFFGTYASQLCYTAHGSEKDKKIMQQVVADKIVALALDPKNANKSVIQFTAMDESTNCDCQYCKAIISEYGSISAAIIMFVNGVDDIVQAALKEYAEENGTKVKDLNILFFAYQNSRFAPNKLDEKTKCNEHVGIYIANSKARYAWTMYDEINSVDAEAIQDWGKFGKIYFWYYAQNAMNYFVPSNTFSATIENFRFAKECNGVWMGNNGVWKCAYQTGFMAFKEYITSKAIFDVNVDFNDVKEQYFEHNFGDGGVYIEQFFDESTAHMTYLRDRGDNTDFNGVCVNENPDKAAYWPLHLVERWNDLCNKALEAIEKTKAEDPELYEAYRRNIILESLFPRYVMCKLYDKSYTDSELKEMQQAFYEDCQLFGMADEGDYTTLDELWKAWGMQ